AALRNRKPSRQDAGGIGKRPGFPRTEQKAHQKQQDKAAANPGERRKGYPADKKRHRPRKRRERRPPQHDPHQHAARAVLVAPTSRRHLEQPIGQGERGRDKAHFGISKAHLFLNGRGRLSHANAVKIKNDTEQAQKEEYAVANAGWTFINRKGGS